MVSTFKIQADRSYETRYPLLPDLSAISDLAA